MGELARALLVFQISSIKAFVRNSDSLLEFADRVLGKSFMDWFLKVQCAVLSFSGREVNRFRVCILRRKRSSAIFAPVR